MGTVAFYLSK